MKVALLGAGTIGAGMARTSSPQATSSPSGTALGLVATDNGAQSSAAAHVNWLDDAQRT
jgi:3-hydroxyacyl-CoA dehydrogenase